MNRKAQNPLHAANALKSNISAHEKERDELYTALNLALDKELGHEFNMGKDSKQGLRIETTEGIGSGGGLLSSGNISLQYLEKYPKLSSDPRFQELFNTISEKEHRIRKKKEEYNEQARWYNHELTYFPKNIKIADDILSEYNRVLNEGLQSLNSCRYINSLLYKFSSEENKQSVTIEIELHQIELKKNLIDSFRDYINANPLEYYTTN